MDFMNEVKNTMNSYLQRTENGALGYQTSGKELLDMNFMVSSFRNKSDGEIENAFSKAYFENPMLAIKWLFYARDARGGLGERRLFRVAFNWLISFDKEVAIKLASLIPEFGRWDDLIFLLNSDAEEISNLVLSEIKNQLVKDMENCANNKPISLLAKWMPSINTSSYATKALARKVIAGLKVTEKTYRKTLSALRAYLKVVETKMCAKEWEEIDYSAVPSRANLIYNSAFLRNDEQRRRSYLAALEKGETKINGSVNFPHDIVSAYSYGSCWHCSTKPYDSTLEALWKALPDYVNGAGNTICVADGSGSMTSKVGNTKVSCLDVANALAIYFAEHSSGAFKDKYITFSSRPQFVDFSAAKSLKQKLEIALKHNECANTNIEAVFDLILNTAVRTHCPQSELPANVLVLSDMEFDSCAESNSVSANYWGCRSYSRPNKTLFDTIAAKFATYGYKMPRLVFWNICSRTGTIPVRQNELGVALVSGFSPAIASMVLSGKTDPFECLVEQLSKPRYQVIEDRLRN